MEVVTLSKTELEGIIETTVSKCLQKYRPAVPLTSVSDDIGIEEVCKITGGKKSYIYAQTCRGDMPFKRRGKFLIFSRKEILTWLESKTIRKVSPAAEAEAQVISEATRKALR